jgi:hypothetical protein
VARTCPFFLTNNNLYMNILEKQITGILIAISIGIVFFYIKSIYRFLKMKVFFKFLEWRLKRMASKYGDQETKDILKEAAKLSNKCYKEEKLFDENEE